MTPVDFHFVTPEGNPFVNAAVEIQLSRATFDETISGIVMPRPLQATTDEDGKCTVELWPSNRTYFVTVEDSQSEAALFYKFIVPVLEVPGTHVRLQDIVIDGEISEVTYDEAAIAAIQQAKASALASMVSAAEDAGIAAAAVATVNSARDAALQAADDIEALASGVAANVTTVNNKTTEASGYATAALNSANAASGSAGAANTSAGQAQGYRDTAQGHAQTASTQAGIAEAQATLAGTRAGDAQTQVGLAAAQVTLAQNQVTIAAGHAGTANTKAGEASGYATAAMGYRDTASGHATTATNKAAEASGHADDAADSAAQAAASAGAATEGGIRWDTGQSLTGPQQVQAQTNIGFVAAVRATVLTGLSTATGTVVTAAHSVLQALGFLQKQVSDLSTTVGNKANIASPTFTGTVGGITKSMVGLGNVDNTTDAAKPISTATQTALDAKAASSALTTHTGDTANPHATTKAQVGLGSVDNVSAASLRDRSTHTGTQAQSTVVNLTTDLAAKAPSAAPTLTGAIALNGSVRRPANAVAALDIDCSAGNSFTKTVAGASTFTFSNPPASGTDFGFKLKVVHTSGVITWPASVKWRKDTAPTLTTGKTHLFYFTTDNGGTTWRGGVSEDYAS